MCYLSWLISMLHSYFVLILRDVALFSMFSKMGSYYASKIMQALALLRPEHVLPQLVDKYVTFLFRSHITGRDSVLHVQ